MSAKHRIVITGGGTGGHVYPALAVHEKLKSDPEVEAILYIGAKGHLEERLAAERKIEFVGLNSAGLPRKLSPALVTWPFKMYAAISEARKHLERFHPTAILGTGGYAAAPPLAAALLMKVPYAIHEPDAHPGLVNRVFARWASLCSLGMEAATEQLKCTHGTIKVNGNPISDKFASPLSRVDACAVLGLNPGMRTLLITGGSQGAQAVNDCVWQALPELLALQPPIQILHQVGEKNFDEFKKRVDAGPPTDGRYHIKPYIDDVAVAYAATDLTVCRAGAMTIADLTVSGTPAIFVPYPFAAQDHQTSNARYVESKNAAIVIPQTELNRSRLADTVRSLLSDQVKLKNMRQQMAALGKPDAARDIAEQLKELRMTS